MVSPRARFVRQVAFIVAALAVSVALFAVIRAAFLRSDAEHAIAQAASSLASATETLTAADTERTAEERIVSSLIHLERSAAMLDAAASASRAYEELRGSPFPLLSGIARAFEPPAAVPASLSAAVVTLSVRVSWRADALPALRKLQGYDAEADVGGLVPESDARELIRRIYLAKDGMLRVADALLNPPFADESNAVSDVRNAVNKALGTVDPLIVAVDTGRWSVSRELLGRYLAESEDARNAAETAYTGLSADSSLEAMIGDIRN
jgi:hypothetical protein